MNQVEPTINSSDANQQTLSQDGQQQSLPEGGQGQQPPAQPQSIPYERFQEVIQQKNQFAEAMAAMQQQNQFLQQQMQQLAQPPQPEKKPINPQEYWTLAETNPEAWQQQIIDQAVTVALQKAQQELAPQITQQATSTLQQQAQTQQALASAFNAAIARDARFNNPAVQTMLVNHALALNSQLPSHFTINDVVNTAADQLLQALGTAAPNPQMVADGGGNLVPNSVSTLQANKHAAVQKKDPYAIALASLQSLKSKTQ